MNRTDRAFTLLLVTACGAASLFALPLAITLFPGAIQHALHGYDAVAAVCAAALYRIGEELPPLGIVVLALTGASVTLGAGKAVRTIRRTQRALASHRAIPTPARLADAARTVGVERAVVCFDDPVPFAYCRGFIKPTIWISTGTLRRLRPRELEAVLVHEDAHRRERDPLRIVVSRVLAAFFFPLPLIRLLALRFEVAKELVADEAAIRAQGTTAHLASALYAMGDAYPAVVMADVAVGAWSLTHARVDQLCGAASGDPLPRASRRSRGLTLAALVMLLLLTFGQAARADLVPATIVEMLEPTMSAADIHSCPLPLSGMLF